MHRRSKQSRAQEFAEKARETLGPATEQAKEKLGPQVEHARKTLEPHVKEARKSLEPHVKQARKSLEPHVKEAREKLEPYFDEALERLVPYVDEARTKANEKLIPAAEQAAKEARTRFHDDVVPTLSAALAAATEASEPYRDEAKRRGAATVAAMRGEVEAPKKKKSHKLRKLVLLLGLGGAAAYAYKKLTGNDADSAWQSSYEPTPAPPTSAPRPTVVPDPEGNDAGAASPDVAMADAETEPHAPTDPDDPLEKRDLS